MRHNISEKLFRQDISTLSLKSHFSEWTKIAEQITKPRSSLYSQIKVIAESSHTLDPIGKQLSLDSCTSEWTKMAEQITKPRSSLYSQIKVIAESSHTLDPIGKRLSLDSYGSEFSQMAKQIAKQRIKLEELFLVPSDIFNSECIPLKSIDELLKNDDYTNEDEIEESSIEVISEEDFKKLQKVDFFSMIEFQTICKDPQRMKKLHWREFEKFSAQLIDLLGFENVKLLPRSNDKGRDIIAIKKFNGLEIIFAFECKQYSNTIQLEKMRALLGTIFLTKAHKGVLLTTSNLASGIRKLIRNEPYLDAKDFNDIVNWIQSLKSN